MAGRRVETAFQNLVQEGEGFSHAGFHSAFGKVKDLSDFAELQVLEVTENHNATVMLGQLAESITHEGSLLGCNEGSGGGGRNGGRFSPWLFWFGAISPALLEAELAAPLDAPHFVQAKVDGYAPEERGEFGRLVIIRTTGVDAGEGFLGDVVGLVGIAKHSEAQALNRLLPPLEEVSESLRIVMHLHAPHGLLIAQDEDGPEKRHGQVAIRRGLGPREEARFGWLALVMFSV